MRPAAVLSPDTRARLQENDAMTVDAVCLDASGFIEACQVSCTHVRKGTQQSMGWGHAFFTQPGLGLAMTPPHRAECRYSAVLQCPEANITFG